MRWVGSRSSWSSRSNGRDRRSRSARTSATTGGASARALVVVTMARKVGVGTAVDLDAVRALAAEALPVFERTGNHYAAASVNIALATAAVAAGDLDLLATATEAAEPHARRSGDRFTASRVLWLRGQLADAAGDPMGAYRSVEQSLRLVDELGMSQTVTGMARYLVRYATQAGEQEWPTNGRPSLTVVFLAAWTYYDLTATAAAHNRDGLTHREAGRLDEARIAHLEAQRIYAEAGVVLLGTAFTELALGSSPARPAIEPPPTSTIVPPSRPPSRPARRPGWPWPSRASPRWPGSGTDGGPPKPAGRRSRGVEGLGQAGAPHRSDVAAARARPTGPARRRDRG